MKCNNTFLAVICFMFMKVRTKTVCLNKNIFVFLANLHLEYIVKMLR